MTSHRRNMALFFPNFAFHSPIVSSPDFMFKSQMQTWKIALKIQFSRIEYKRSRKVQSLKKKTLFFLGLIRTPDLSQKKTRSYQGHIQQFWNWKGGGNWKGPHIVHYRTIRTSKFGSMKRLYYNAMTLTRFCGSAIAMVWWHDYAIPRWYDADDPIAR